MSETADTTTNSNLNLKDFKIQKILFNLVAKKMIGLLGTFAGSETDVGIVILEKVGYLEEQFTTDDDNNAFLKSIGIDETVLVNDIYSDFIGKSMDPKFNKLKISITFPATEKHIAKYENQELHLVQETPEIYQTVTLPHLDSEQFSLDWVYNILDHKKEEERILYEDRDATNGFVLLPDFKWNGQNESLYLLAIVNDRTIKSIRDLNQNHSQLLENIRSKSLETIEAKFNLGSSQIRAYFHYQPSFYHLHVHFTYLKYDAPGIYCEKSHLLDTVISNIKLMPDYYQKATLTFAVREKDKLYSAIKKADASGAD